MNIRNAAKLGLVVALASGLVSPALATEAEQDQQATAVPTIAPGASAPEEAMVELPTLLAANELDDARGRATVVLNDQDIDGVVSDNAIGDYAAGAIALSDNALSNFSGVGNFLFNTGAQNNLQAGMSLTIVVEN